MASFGGALDFSQDDSSDNSGGLVGSILQSVTSLGQSYILASNPPNPVLSYPVAPPSNIGYGGPTSPFSLSGSRSGSSSLIWIVLLAAVAYFLFLKK